MVFATGCHRSGTSLLASILDDLIAPQHERCEDLVVAPDNPLGFFETRELVELNDLLLAVNDCSWDVPPVVPPIWSQRPRHCHLFDSARRHQFEVYACSERWVDKDPRLCLTYPAMFHLLLKRVPLAVSIRPPLEVAASLHARDGLDLAHGLVLWWIYNASIALSLLPTDLVVDYQSLLGNGEARERISADIATFAGSILGDVSPGCVGALLQEKVSIELNRSGPSLEQFDPGLPAIGPLLAVCDQAYSRIVRAKQPIEAMKACFAVLPLVVLEQGLAMRCLAIPASRLSSTKQDGVVREQESPVIDPLAHALSQRCERAERKLELIEGSTIWRLTAPLRSFLDRWRS